MNTNNTTNELENEDVAKFEKLCSSIIESIAPYYYYRAPSFYASVEFNGNEYGLTVTRPAIEYRFSSEGASIICVDDSDSDRDFAQALGDEGIEISEIDDYICDKLNASEILDKIERASLVGEYDSEKDFLAALAKEYNLTKKQAKWLYRKVESDASLDDDFYFPGHLYAEESWNELQAAREIK